MGVTNAVKTCDDKCNSYKVDDCEAGGARSDAAAFARAIDDATVAVNMMVGTAPIGSNCGFPE